MEAEKIASYSYRIEDLHNIDEKFCKWVGIEDIGKFKKCMKKTSKRTNSYRDLGKGLKWEALEKEDIKLSNDIKKLATHYGYEFG